MRQRFQWGGRVYEVDLENTGGGYRAVVDEEALAFELLDAQPGQVSLRVGGKPVVIHWAVDESALWLALGGCTYRLEKPRPAAAGAGAESAAGGAVRSPMPAQVRAVQVEAGQVVEAGQTLLLLEAMKMEIRVRAPAAGRVSRLLVSEGQAVVKEQVLVEMEEEHAG